jgi:hypothetical protein
VVQLVQDILENYVGVEEEHEEEVSSINNSDGRDYNFDDDI